MVWDTTELARYNGWPVSTCFFSQGGSAAKSAAAARTRTGSALRNIYRPVAPHGVRRMARALGGATHAQAHGAGLDARHRRSLTAADQPALPQEPGEGGDDRAQH